MSCRISALLCSVLIFFHLCPRSSLTIFQSAGRFSCCDVPTSRATLGYAPRFHSADPPPGELAYALPARSPADVAAPDVFRGRCTFRVLLFFFLLGHSKRACLLCCVFLLLFLGLLVSRVVKASFSFCPCSVELFPSTLDGLVPVCMTALSRI